MIKCIKKLIKKQNLINKYKKNNKEWNDHFWLLKKFNWDKEQSHYFKHQFMCEIRCYNRIKNLK